MHLEECDVIALTMRPFFGKETKRMLYQIQVLVFFTNLQKSLRIQKDSILGIMDKDWSTTFKLVPPCRNNFYARKRHTLMVSFMAAHLGSSVAETSRPWLLHD